MLELLMDNYATVLALLVALLAGFKWTRYLLFVKELIDIYAAYYEAKKNGIWTDEEKLKLGSELIEAIENGKVTFKKVQKLQQ